jgi:hypothetical protein
MDGLEFVDVVWVRVAQDMDCYGFSMNMTFVRHVL